MDIKSQLVSQVWGQTHDQHCGNCRQLVTTYENISAFSKNILVATNLSQSPGQQCVYCASEIFYEDKNYL